MEEYEITWDTSATDTLRTIYNRIKNKYGINRADKFRMDIVTKVDGLRKMPTSYPLEPALYHRPEKFRFIKLSEYKIIYQIFEQENQVVILEIFHAKQNPDKFKEAFK